MLSQEKAYRAQGWQRVPGFGDDYLFSPDAIKAINDIFVDGKEVGGTFMRLMDGATSEVRQAAFVADASAWSLQGLMMAFQSPGTVFANIPELMAATVLGRSSRTGGCEQLPNSWPITTRAAVSRARDRGHGKPGSHVW